LIKSIFCTLFSVEYAYALKILLLDSGISLGAGLGLVISLGNRELFYKLFVVGKGKGSGVIDSG